MEHFSRLAAGSKQQRLWGKRYRDDPQRTWLMNKPWWRATATTTASATTASSSSTAVFRRRRHAWTINYFWSVWLAPADRRRHHLRNREEGWETIISEKLTPGGEIFMTLFSTIWGQRGGGLIICRGSLEGAFTIFSLHLKLFSEPFHLKVNTFFTSSNGLAYFDVKNLECCSK